jgi:hypothetical protein
VTRTREISLADLKARRQAILDRLGTSYPDLAARAEQRSLVGDEWSAWDELQGIDFLIGDDQVTR